MITVKTACCNTEFQWKEPTQNSYGADMPKFCPVCGKKITEQNPLIVL